METNNSSKNYKIIFTEDEFPILDALIKKYGLEDLDDKAISNTDEKNPIASPSLTILNIASDTVEGLLETKNIPELLKTSLNLSEKNAKDLTEDIKTKLISICKKVSSEGIPEEKPVTAIPVHLINEVENPNIAKKPAVVSKPVAPVKEKKKVIKEEPQSLPRQPDNYREPIE